LAAQKCWLQPGLSQLVQPVPVLHLISVVDIAHTVLKLAGADLPAYLQGQVEAKAVRYDWEESDIVTAP